MHLWKQPYYVFVEQFFKDENEQPLKKRASPKSKLIYVLNPDNAYLFNYSLYGETEVSAFVKPFLEQNEALEHLRKQSEYSRAGELGRLMLIMVKARSPSKACQTLMKNDFRANKWPKGTVIKEIPVGTGQK